MTSSWFKTLVVGLSLACSGAPASDALASGGSAPCRAMNKGETVRLDFKETALGTVARTISCLVDVNLLFQPAHLSRKTVSLVGPKPLRRADVWRLFVAMLDTHKLEVQRRGAFYTIGPSKGP